jgi:hypothetical protein
MIVERWKSHRVCRRNVVQIVSNIPTHVIPRAMIDPGRRFSPLMLSDRLITLAEDADHAGHREVAAALIGLAYTVLDEQPLQ